MKVVKVNIKYNFYGELKYKILHIMEEFKMNENKLRVLNLIIGMWENDIVQENGCESFEDWCNEN